MPLSSDKHIVDQKVREALRNYRAQPSGRVWNKVSQQLNSSEKKRASIGNAIAVLFLLLLTGGGFWMVSTNNAPKNISYSEPANSITQKINHEGNNIPARNNPSEKTSTDKKINADNQSRQSSAVAMLVMPSTHSGVEEAIIPQIYSTSVNEEVTPAFSDELNMVSSQRSENADMKLIESKNTLAAKSPMISEKENYLKNYRYPKIVYSPNYYKANVKGAYAGFGQNINSTWIIDREAITNKTLKYEPTFGTALMVQGGYNFSNRWGIEGAWVVHSGEGQKYKYIPVYSRTTSLVYYQKHIAFDYMQVPVMVRYKVQGWSGLIQVPFFVNYSLGVQYGRMVSYAVDETKEKASEGHLFRKNEYAAVASVDYDFLTRGAAFFTLGVRASMGSGLFIKDTPEDLEFDHPHNFVIGIHGAMNFSLQKKQVTGIK